MEIITSNSGLEIKGKLVFATVSDAKKIAKTLLEDNQSQKIRFDFENLTKLDSAGLALLIDWKRWCDKHNKAFQVINANPKATSLIATYKLTKILNLGHP